VDANEEPGRSIKLHRRRKLERGIRVGTASMFALLGVQLMLPEKR
jgi:hypothetical protein